MVLFPFQVSGIVSRRSREPLIIQRVERVTQPSASGGPPKSLAPPHAKAPQGDPEVADWMSGNVVYDAGSAL